VCVDIVYLRSSEFTEDICDDCQAEDHDECDEASFGYEDESPVPPCACNNSDHLLTDPAKFAQRFIELAQSGR
jgi:hypothetical protein